jgi:uncharacterized membrane protein
MVDVQTQILVHCPIGKVSAYAADPDNAPIWYANIHSVEWKTPKPLAIGSLIAFKAKFLGRELSYTYEIIQYEPGKKLVMRTSEGPFPMETTYTWEKIDAGITRMQLINRGEPSGFSKLFAPFMSRAMRKANERDLQAIKSILEHEKK